MNIMQHRQRKYLLIPFLIILCPWFYLLLWIPPFSLIPSLPFELLTIFTGEFLPDIGLLFLEDAPLLLYVMLAGAVILNIRNAMLLYKTQNLQKAKTGLFVIRTASAFTYPALLWGLLLAIFFLMGPDRNKHIFFLIALSFPALNISGALYAIPLILQLKKEQKIGVPASVCSILFQFIIGLDLITVLYINKKMKA